MQKLKTISISASGNYKHTLDIVYRYCIICKQFKLLNQFADDKSSKGKTYKKGSAIKKTNVRIKKKRICIKCIGD